MQKDLFGGAIASAVLPNQPESKTDFLHKYQFVLRLDQAIIGILVLMVAYVLVFSFGVESGKRFAMAEIKAERAMRERMARELGEKIFANTAVTTGNEVAPSSPVKAVTKVTEDIVAKKPEVTIASAKNALDSPDSNVAEIGKFMIQTVTFTTKNSAEKHIKLLMAKGYKGRIVPRGKFQQVCVTGFENKEKALQAMGKLKSQGLAPKDAYVRAVV